MYLYRVSSVLDSACLCLVAWKPSTSSDQPMYDGPDLPTSDLPEDRFAPEPQPLPLDPARLHKVEGYDGCGYHVNGQ